ncbi:MAG: DUF3078 domain-containing protein [Bacteroidales bacterium]|nr:DUF3078 domain-containing protein [Bacteroidales bacterium]
MKKVFMLIVAALSATAVLSAQDAQKAAAEAAAALTAANDVPVAAPKPVYWTNSILNQINFGQTALWNWAAGGYNNYTLAAAIDAKADYKKDKTLWTNRLQLDYGFLYSADKPILQKTKDRIYFESKWGYETPVKHLSYSANFDFKTQFNNNYKYGTPTNFAGEEPTIQEWLDARTLMSGLLSPAYTNLGFGVLWTPKPWFSLNFSPLTADLVIVKDPALRNTYGMELKEEGLDKTVGDNFKPVRFGLGAQLKADASWVINDEFSYTTQLVLFSDYLHKPQNLRVNWDNKMFWKLAKYFALTLSTNLIYDENVKVKALSDGTKVPAVQFKEYLEFGFTYTIAKK